MLAPAATRGTAPNIGRGSMGWGVGIDALASPIWAQAMIPPLSVSAGRTPKNAGSQSTRSASLPTATEPMSASRPWATVVEAVLRGDGARAARGLGEGQVFGDRRLEVVAHHEHVEVLVDGVHGVRP